MRQAHTHTNSILTLFCEICNTKEDFIFLRNKGICQICDIGKTEVRKVERRSKIGLTYSGRTMRCIVTNAKCLSRFVITTPRAPDNRSVATPRSSHSTNHFFGLFSQNSKTFGIANLVATHKFWRTAHTRGNK